MRARFDTHLSDHLKEHMDRQWVLLHASCAIEEEELPQITTRTENIYGLNLNILRSSTKLFEDLK
jgi:hypothetical protein